MKYSFIFGAIIGFLVGLVGIFVWGKEGSDSILLFLMVWPAVFSPILTPFIQALIWGSIGSFIYFVFHMNDYYRPPPLTRYSGDRSGAGKKDKSRKDLPLNGSIEAEQDNVPGGK